MKWIRGYFQAVNGGGRKWEMLWGMWLVYFKGTKKRWGWMEVSVETNHFFFFLFFSKTHKRRAFRLFLAVSRKPFRNEAPADLHGALIFLGRGQGKSFISSYFWYIVNDDLVQRNIWFSRKSSERNDLSLDGSTAVWDFNSATLVTKKLNSLAVCTVMMDRQKKKQYLLLVLPSARSAAFVGPLVRFCVYLSSGW